MVLTWSRISLEPSEKVDQLRRENDFMEIKNIYTVARLNISCVQALLPRRNMTSSAALKDNVPKTYKDALSSGLV